MNRTTFLHSIKKPGGAIAAVVVVGLVALGGVLALVIVQLTASVTSNEFTTTTSSTTTTTTTTVPVPPGGEGLRLGLGTGPGFGSCGALTAATEIPLGAFDFDLNTGVSSTQFLCVTNSAGFGSIGTLQVGAITTATADLACSAAESAVDPDGASCQPDGELAAIVNFELVRTFNNSSACIGNPLTLASGGTVDLIGAALFPGDECVFQIELAFAGTPTDEQKTAASTDSASYTLSVQASN
jgi:hypothetical protein